MTRRRAAWNHIQPSEFLLRTPAWLWVPYGNLPIGRMDAKEALALVKFLPVAANKTGVLLPKSLRAPTPSWIAAHGAADLIG